MGFGGEDCAISLTDLPQPRGDPAGAGGPGSAEGAAFLNLGEMDGFQDLQRESEDLVPEGGVLASGGGDGPGESLPGLSSSALRNMLLYAESVNSFGARERRNLAQLDAQTGDVGCGFYDIFYEGGGSASCFYDAIPCTKENAFYDFYTGSFINHAPVTHLDEKFSSAPFGAGVATMSAGSAQVTPTSEGYLGGLAAADTLPISVSGLPASSSDVTVSFDLYVDGDIGAAPYATLTVFGEGAVAASTTFVAPKYLVGMRQVQLKYEFTYAMPSIKFKIAAAGVTGTWGIDNLVVSSVTGNYKPTAEDKTLFIDANPFGGTDGEIAASKGTNAIELRGADDECEELTYKVEALPSKGLLYHTSCDNLWTKPITEADLPATVAGPCHRVVYAPQANLPASSGSSAFDAFKYVVVDSSGFASDPATVEVYVTQAPSANSVPVAGSEGLALAFDGVDDVLSLTTALSLPTDAFTVEMRFKADSWNAGTLLDAPGALRVSTTGKTVAATLTGSAGTVSVESGSIADAMWHHLAITYDADMFSLYVDGALAATSAAQGSMVPATAGVTVGAVVSGGKVSAAVNGYIDELAVWAVSRSAADVAATKAGGLSGSESGLLALHTFNLGGDVPSSHASYDATSNQMDAFRGTLNTAGVSAGIMAEYPTYVASTDVFGNAFSVDEDTSVDYALTGSDVEGGVTYHIATLPLHGNLYDNAKLVSYSPFPLSGGTVKYTPDPDFDGTDVFKYRVSDGDKLSYRQGVTVTVNGVNDAPTCPLMATVTTGVAEKKLVTLTNGDVDGDFVALQITRLPENGNLHQATLDGKENGLITEVGTLVTSSAGLVIYEPLDVGTDASLGFPFDTFAYSVEDAVTTSGECQVQVSIPYDGCAAAKPVAGDSGYGLKFDGVDDAVNFGALTTYTASASFSVELFFKTSSSSTMDLLEAGPLSVSWINMFGLTLQVGSASASSYQTLNDDYWHYLVVTYDASTGTGSLYVDGALLATAADASAAAPGVLTLGSSAGTAIVESFRGAIDEVSVWGTVRDGSFSPGLLGQGTYAHTKLALDASMAALWKMNEAKGNLITDVVAGAPVALSAAGATAQPTFVPSYIPRGDVYYVVEGDHEEITLACSSEQTDTLDAVILTLPAGGSLYYTTSGSDKSFEITATPTILKDRKVIYVADPFGDTTPEKPNYGDFAYSCIGDLDVTVNDLISSAMYSPLSSKLDDVSLLLGKTGRALIEEAPLPPLRIHRRVLLEAAPPAVFDSVDFFYGTLPVVGEAPEIPPAVVEEVAVVVPPIVDPPAPSIDEAADEVITEIINDLFPATGTRGVDSISAVKFEAKIPGINYDDFIKDADFKRTFEADLKQSVAASAGVPVSAVTIVGYADGSLLVITSVAYATGSSQSAAVAFESKLNTDVSQVFDTSFTASYGTTEVLQVKTDTVTTTVTDGVSSSCFQISASRTLQIASSHQNQHPVGCAAAGAVCTHSLPLGDFSPVTVTLPATDIDGDAMTVMVTRLPHQGTLHFGTPTSWDNSVPLGAVLSAAPFSVVYQPIKTTSAGDTFSYVIMDGEATSEESDIVVSAHADEVAKPLTGNTGYALKFDGEDDEAQLGSYAAYGLGAGATFGMWFKTLSHAHGATLLSAGPYTLAWDKVQGLQFAVGDAVVSNSKAYNDGHWHYVVAAFDGQAAYLTVDDDQAVAAGVAPPAGGSGAVTLGAAAGSTGFFGGEVDEFVIFASDAHDLLRSVEWSGKCSSSTYGCFTSADTGLKGYWKFNDSHGSALASEVPAPVGSMDMVLGSAGKASTYPAWVQSSIPQKDAIELLEDTTVSFSLEAIVEAGSSSTIKITTKPSNGQLYVGGKKLYTGKTVPAASVFQYTPKADYSGADAFAYSALNDAGVEGPATEVKLTVHAINDPPTAASAVVAVDFKDPTPVKVDLVASDVDSTTPVLQLTYLPQKGLLYTDSAGTTPIPDTLIVPATLYYRPMANGLSGGDTDMFGYVAKEDFTQEKLELNSQPGTVRLANSHLISAEATVTLDGTLSSTGPDTPVSGEAGLALFFDGLTSVATLSSVASYGMAGSFSVSFWMKSIGAGQKSTILEAGGLYVGLSKVGSLAVEFGGEEITGVATLGAIVGATDAYMHATWVKVEVSFAAGALTVLVDGSEVAKKSGLTGALDPAATVTLGGTSGTTSVFHGYLDELSLGDGSTVSGYYRFNEGLGNTLLNEASAAYDGTLGAAGLNLPARTTSTCPISFPVVVVEEDQGATVELKAYFTDATATGVQYKITDLPAKGGLYTSQGGHAITAVPYTLAGSSVYFAPGAHENGAKYATFSYVASLVGATAADSAPAIVTIDVTEVNDAPAVTPSLDLTMAENEVLQVKLTDAAPSDAELDSTSYVLRTLPTLGHLYTSAGVLITAAAAVADGKVTYVPPPNANGAPYTTFSFVVSDGKLDSQEVTVSITIKGTVALMLSPSSSVFIRDGAPLVSTSSYTVDAWVKTDDLAASTYNILSTTTASASLESGAGAPGFTSGLKFPLTMAKVGDTDVASSRWSHVAFVADTGSKKLYLDGQLVGVQATADTAVTDAGSLTLGGNSMPVCLDEVKIYGRALAQHEVLTSMNERIAVGNEAVGKGLDVYLSSGLGSDLVAYWSFDDVAGKTVPDSEGGFDGEITGSAASVKVNAPMVNNDAASLQTLSASSGSAGYAIHFDGVDDAVQGNLAAAGPTADGLSIDLWVKLSSGSTMDMALVEAGGVALAWTKTGGLGLHLAGAGGVDSHLTLNDGAWHHVEATVTHLASGVNVPAATPGSFQLALKIDGAAFAAVSAFADILASTAYTIGGSADASLSPFAGTIDEVCFGSAASKAIYGKVSFDEAYGTSLAGGASVLGNPTWVFSSAPLTMGKLSLFEDTEIMVDVQGFDADGDALTYYLTAAPALGSVYNLGSGTPLIACPAKTTTSLAEAECEGAKIAPTPEGKYVLRYVPDSNAYGAEVIQYVADDGYQSSDPAYVVLDVLPVNDLPALTGAGQSVATVEDSDVVIQLVSAFDEDGDPLSHVITSLPAHGMLLQYPAEPATVIDSLGTAVSDPLLRVVYRPLALDTADAFTYAATDGNEGMCPGTCPSSEPYFTEEATVAVSASAAASNHVPVAGEVGYALVFDGVDDYIYVEGESFSSEPGFTVEMYIKTADANVEYTTLAAAFNPLGEAMKLYMTKFGGLVLEAAGGGLFTGAAVNDGNWHLVTCSVGATVAIVVDGIEMASSKLAAPVTFDALAIGGQPSSGASSGFFSGLIDDVRVWSLARSANDVLLSKNRIVASGSATGLSIHYPFDGMSTKSDLVLDEAEGDGARDGKVFGGASRTPSSAPLTQYSYTMTEDSHDALYVPLAGTDDDFDVLDFLVTTLPPKGQLYTLEGVAITATPYKVASGSSAGVQYRPAAHGHGAPYTQFGYAVYDGQAMSKEALVDVHVTSVNDAPAPVGLSGLSVESTKSLVITLEATDVDLPDDSVTLAVSTLPDAGTLYTLNADSTVGVPITAPRTSLVTAVSGQTATAQVVLMPADDLGDLPSHTVSFGFVGMDAAGEVSHEEMVEVEVTQEIVLGQVSTVPDALGTGGFVAGLVGHAVVLDGVAQQVTLPHSDLFEADFTLEVYFKTSAAIHEDIALVTQAGSFFLGWKLFKGLTFVLESAGATGSTSVHTGQTFNDAAWHHVAVTFASSTQQLKIFVDGVMLKAATSEAGFSQVTGSPAQVVLGASGSADGLTGPADNFKGYIDEVRVWGVAKAEAAVAAHRSVKITPGAMKPDLGAGLRVLYTFDGDLEDLCPVAGATCPAAVHLPGPPTFVSSGAPLFMKTLKLGKGWGEGNAMGFYPSAAEGGPDNVGINLLGTDLDYDGLSFEITSLPSHGTVSFAEGSAMTVIDQVPYRMAKDGVPGPRHHAQVVYTPAPGEYADVQIGYTVWDGLVRSAEALVTIEIEEKNRAPVTGGDVAVTATVDTCGAAVGNDRTAVPTVSYDPAFGSTEHKFAPAVWWADSCGGMANIYPVVMEASDADGDAFDVIVTTLPGFGTLYQTADGVTPTLSSKVTPGSVVSYREGGKATLLYSTIDLDAVTDPGTATSFGFKAVDAKGFTSGESIVSVTLAGASADFAIFSGIKGFALMLDGVDDAFDLPAEEIAGGGFGSGFTVGMWVKSTGAILQGSTLFSAVTSAGKGFRASWTHAGGLEVSVELVSEESMARGSAAGKPLSAKAASGKQLNDGQWHFVDIEYDTSSGLDSPLAQVCVRIDDGLGSCASASELSATFVPSAMALGKDITSGGGTMFKGMVDELRVYGAALTTARHPEQPGWHSRSGGAYGAASLFMHQALMGTEKDLVAYFRFNDVATLQTDNKVMNLVSDKLVPVAGSPSAMSSTVPIMLKVTTEEDEAVLLSLTGVEFSAAALNAVVTKLPALGKLHQVLPSGLAGAEITFVPAPVADSANRVIFAPAAREHGVDFGNMKFYTEDPASGAKSDEDTILFSVKPVNYAPVLTAPFSEITITTFEDVAIKLEATDPDGEDALHFVITTVPTMGTLYASADGVTKGSVIASADTPIAGGFVIFSPVTLDTVNVLTLGGTTYFGYTVTDGQLGPEKLSEALVSLTVPRSPVSSPIVAGDAAYALMFDGKDPAAADKALKVGELGLTSGFTVETWVKTSQAVSALDSMTLVELSGFFRLTVSKITGLRFVVTDVGGFDYDVEGSGAINDGAWHFIAATFEAAPYGKANSGTLRLYVDGTEVASKLFDGMTMANLESELEVGKGFTGLMDDLRIWSVALEPASYSPRPSYDWDSSGMSSLSGFEDGLQLYYRFNEAGGSTAASSGPTQADLQTGSAMWVPSAAPFGNKLNVAEDSSTPFALQGSGDVAMITLMPSHGSLHLSDDGKTTKGAIGAANTVLDLNALKAAYVVYVPDADYFGLDSFAYVSDSQPASSASAEVVVAITVHAVNDRPRVTFASEGLTTPKNTPVSVVIKGEDIDGPGAATAMITALPQSGLLFQADGSAIVGTPTAVTSPEGAVLYTPEANGFGAPFDSFSFVVTDSVASSEEHTVEITVTPDMAEVLDGSSDLHAGLVLPAEYTMEVWVKALGAGAAAGRRLHGYQLTREYQAAGGDFFNFTTPGVGTPGMDLAAAGVGVGGAPLTVLDGQWHHVAAVVKDSLKMVYIDGQLDTSQSFAPAGAGVDSLVSVFYASLGPNQLQGVVDDFKVWSYAKTLQDLRQSLHAPVAGDEAGLLVHDDFAHGSYYVSSPIAGEAGYAVETSAAEYVWFDSYPEWQIPSSGWSISAWFKSSAVVSDYAGLVTKGAFLGTMGLGGEWALQWTREGGLGFHVCEYCTSSSPDQVIASANSYNLYNDGYWHHVAGTFDPALKTIAIYVDGQLPAGAKSLAPISNIYLEDLGSRITVGRDDKGSAQSIFFGQVDEVSVFDYPLNKAEVISLSRHADVAPGDKGKRVTWKFNTPAALAVQAEQGAGEPGTASSAAAFKPSTLPIPTDLSIVGFGVSQVVPLHGADPDGDRLEYLITEVPAKGQLYFTENGALGAQVLRAGVATAAGPLIYVSGEDDEPGAGPYATFKYAVTDGREVSADVEMRVFVFGKNKAPTVALAAPVETLEEAAVTVTLLVADKEGHDVTVAVAGGPTNGQVSTSLITKGEDGSFTFVYTPDPDFYGVDVVTVVATDSQGTSALPFDVLITVKGVNDGPVVTAPPSIEMTFEEMVLPGISVADVDAENAVLTATLTTTVGFLSTVSVADAKAGKLLQVTVSGQLEELNDKLGKIFIYNEAMVAGTITLTVTDNGGTGLGGPVLVTVEIPVTTKILPIQSAHITNNLLGIRAKYRFPSDGLTSAVDGDCSAVLMSDTIKRIGPSACALNGQGAGCPVCAFSTPTDLSVIFGTDPTIMPGDSVVFKAGVVSIACGPGDAAIGCVTGPQPVMTVVLQPPTERIPPVVAITGPAEVGQCDALSLSAVLTSGFGGRPATATWSLAPPVPSGAATAAGLLYTVAADVPAAAYSASVQVVNFLGQVTSQAFAFTKNALPLPTLALEEDTFEVYRSNEVKVVAVAKPSSCEGAGADLTYTWSFLQGPVDDPFFPAGFLAGWIAQQTGSTLLIPKDFLVPTFIEPYVIQVSVADPATPEIAVAATATVAVLAQDLRVIVEGPDRVSVSTPFSLDGEHARPGAVLTASKRPSGRFEAVNNPLPPA